MENLAKDLIAQLAIAIEVIAGGIVALAAIEATYHTLSLFFWRRRAAETQQSRVRLRFGGWLVMALEFTLAADILRSAISPTWSDIGKLTAIALLRSALNFLLQREIEMVGKQNQM
ncbi:MAG: DUF1622 domain-containing protein [Scytolyngbya sp. HA4215-MV1]|jgi:uncharacterized membrane protein|nr:DUF1622 domain-containing protein [Scytolyngbya sp. HA4215-MV1]